MHFLVNKQVYTHVRFFSQHTVVKYRLNIALGRTDLRIDLNLFFSQHTRVNTYTHFLSQHTIVEYRKNIALGRIDLERFFSQHTHVNSCFAPSRRVSQIFPGKTPPGPPPNRCDRFVGGRDIGRGRKWAPVCVCVTWLVYMCDLCVCVTWHIHMQEGVQGQACVRVTWLIYVWHDSIVSATCLVHMRDTTHSSVLTHMRDMSHW